MLGDRRQPQLVSKALATFKDVYRQPQGVTLRTPLDERQSHSSADARCPSGVRWGPLGSSVPPRSPARLRAGWVAGAIASVVVSEPATHSVARGFGEHPGGSHREGTPLGVRALLPRTLPVTGTR
jgi:hypothetical protein